MSSSFPGSNLSLIEFHFTLKMYCFNHNILFRIIIVCPENKRTTKHIDVYFSTGTVKRRVNIYFGNNVRILPLPTCTTHVNNYQHWFNTLCAIWTYECPKSMEKESLYSYQNNIDICFGNLLPRVFILKT